MKTKITLTLALIMIFVGFYGTYQLAYSKGRAGGIKDMNDKNYETIFKKLRTFKKDCVSSGGIFTPWEEDEDGVSVGICQNMTEGFPNFTRIIIRSKFNIKK